MRVTIFVKKATAELDFLLPLLWRMRKFWTSTSICIFYCTLSKAQILRRANLYSQMLKEFNVDEYDFIDFIGTPLWISSSLRRVLKHSAWDSFPKMPPYISKVLRHSLQRLSRWIELRIDFEKMFQTLRAEIVFWPPRSYAFSQEHKLWQMLGNDKSLIVLYPHGAFYSGGSYRVPLPPNGQQAYDKDIRDNYEIWYPHAADPVPDSYPKSRERFFYSGYPGLDNEWLYYMEQRFAKRETAEARDSLRCLFIIRKFERNNTDDWILEHDEFIHLFQKVVEGLNYCGRRVHLAVKPHPSNDYPAVRRMLAAAGYPDSEITYAPNYVEAAKCDFVISVPSTSTLIPALHGLPVVFLNCSVKATFDRWPPMQRLYPETMQFFASGTGDIPKKIGEVVNYVTEHEPSREIPVYQTKDVVHFRKHFPDGMLGNLESRLKHIYAKYSRVSEV